jgi:hypothetical protein
MIPENKKKLKQLENIILKYALNNTNPPSTDVALQLYHEMDIDELMFALDQPAIFDLNLLQSIKMTTKEFREAQKEALWLHVMLIAEPILKNRTTRIGGKNA